MRQALKDVNRKLKSGCFYLLDMVLSYDTRPDIRAIKGFKQWLQKKPGFVAALLLIVGVVLLGYFVVYPKITLAWNLRAETTVESAQYEAKLEQKRQRLAAVLSHLEANPQIETPGNHQSLIGPYAKMGWKYGTTENGVGQSSRKHAVIDIQNTNIIVKDDRGNVTGETTPKWQDSTSSNSADQYSGKHAIVEIRNAATPRDSERAKVTGEAAWYPLTLSKKVNEPGTFLWRVIEGEMDSSGQLRAEGSWGPYSVFTIYPSAYKRIEATKKIRIGTYNVGQVKLESQDLALDEHCLKLSDISSKKDREVLCDVIKVMRTKRMPELDPVVTRYSDIDHKLLPALTAGELDIAFGNISKADYRKGVRFLEYDNPKPILLTSNDRKDAQEIGPDEIIGIVQGTVYERVLGEPRKGEPRKILQGRYRFKVYQNTFDAIGGFLRNDVQWILMMGTQTWEVIKQSEDFKKMPYLYQNTTSNFLKIEPKQYGVGGDAFAITETDSDLHDAICLALREMKKNRDCKTLGSGSSQKEAVSSGVGP